MTLAIILVALMVGIMGYIRLSPPDVARWHVALGEAVRSDGVQVLPGGARATVMFADQTAGQVLARLDAIALATPRTRRIAGSPESGLITWETRSAFWGFPDYTTAAATATAQGATLDLLARLRFGRDDFGVNAARLTAWLHLLRADSAAAAGISP